MNECLFAMGYNNSKAPALLETAEGMNTNLYKRSISCLLYYNSPLSSSPFAATQTFTPVVFAVTCFKFPLPLSLGAKTSFVAVAVPKNIARNSATSGCLLPRNKFAWFVELLLLSSKARSKKGLELLVPLVAGESSLAPKTKQQKQQNVFKRIVSFAGRFFLLSRPINTANALIATSRAWLKITFAECLLKTIPTTKTEKPRPTRKWQLKGDDKSEKTGAVTQPPNGLICATSTKTNAFGADVRARCLKITSSLYPGMVVTTLATFNLSALSATLKKAQKLLIIELRALFSYSFPTLNIDVPMTCGEVAYNGLRIEMKKSAGVPSDVSAEQKDWHDRLRQHGYKVAVCFGWSEAFAVTKNYLGWTQ